MIKELPKSNMDKSKMRMWVTFMFDQYNGNKDRILEKMICVCKDRFYYNNEVEDYILELVGKI